MTMPNDARCGEMAGRIAEAIDGTLSPGDQADLTAHLAVCADCEALYTLGPRGKRWLEAVEDVAPPPSLVHNILAATTFASRTVARPPAGRRAPWAAARSSLRAFFRQPRLVMTSAMAFFSLSMIANVTGATIDDLGQLRPSTLSRRLSLQYHETAAGVTRYYENNRLLRQLQDGLQAVRDVLSEPADDAPEEPKVHG